MKLYRGLKGEVFKEFTDDVSKQHRDSLYKILMIRERGEWDYPSELSKDISWLKKHESLQRLYLTDCRDIAYEYAKSNQGLVIEVDVPIDDILKYFIIEFQNYSKRHTSFELVYFIDSKAFDTHKEDWDIKVVPMNW